MFLKSSKTHRDKFERNQMDEFVIEAVDIGELQKLRSADKFFSFHVSRNLYHSQVKFF